MLHVRLISDHHVRECKTRGKKREGRKAPRSGFQSVYLKVAITILCGVGLYASLFMLGKARRAAQGRLSEESVVQTPRAHLFGNVQNSALGAIYYPALAIAAWLPLWNDVDLTVLGIVAVAAGTSLVLAYSLLYVTRRPCPYCWTSHGVNWLLLFLFVLHLRAEGYLR